MHPLDQQNNFFAPYKEYFLPYAHKKVLITGGTGFIGKWALAAFAYANYAWQLDISVVSLSRNPEAFLTANPEFAKIKCVSYTAGDVLNPASLNSNFDYIIHAAGETANRNNSSDPNYQQKLHSIIVDGTRTILDFLAQQKNARLVLISSLTVYGHIKSTGAHEDDLCAPLNSYGKAKLQAEELCRAANKGNTTIARCITFAGEYLPIDGQFAVGNFMRDALTGQDVVIKGTGNLIRSYMYAGDLMLHILKILSHGQHQRIYNVGSDEPITLKELAAKIVQLTHSSSKIIIHGNEDKGVSLYGIPNIDRVRAELGLQKTYNLDQILLAYAHWVKDYLRR